MFSLIDTSRYASTTILLLANALTLASAARADVRVEQTAVLPPAQPDNEEVERIVSTIRTLTLRAPEGAWESSFLRAGEHSFDLVLRTPLGPLVGMTTIKNGDDDVLVAKWQLGQPASLGARGLWIWDTPDYNWFVVECEPATATSAVATQAFLSQLLKWDFMIPNPLVVRFRYAESGQHLFRGYSYQEQEEYGHEYRLFGLRADSGVYTLLKLGKGQFSALGYPEGGIYVPERFPPLETSVKGWSKGYILAEVGRLWSRSTAFAHNNNRDVILISEAARRGLDRTDLEMLLLPSSAPGIVAWGQRVRAVMGALIETHQLDRHKEDIEEITIRLGNREDAGGSTLREIFMELLRSSNDYTGMALQCLSTCVYAEPPLWYLANRGNSEDVYRKVGQAAVTGLSAKEAQRDALESIRARIDKAKPPR
jgi:hypothetical protein